MARTGERPMGASRARGRRERSERRGWGGAECDLREHSGGERFYREPRGAVRRRCGHTAPGNSSPTRASQTLYKYQYQMLYKYQYRMLYKY